MKMVPKAWIRTGDLLFTKQLLCQLSYKGVARQEGVEPPTCGFGDRCSAN